MKCQSDLKLPDAIFTYTIGAAALLVFYHHGNVRLIRFIYPAYSISDT